MRYTNKLSQDTLRIKMDRHRRGYERGVAAALQYIGGVPHKGPWREAAKLKIPADERADFVEGFLSELKNISGNPVDNVD